MDWLTWSTEVLQAVAWPSVVLVLGFTFKKELSALLHRVISVKGFGTEASFREQLDTVESKVDAVEVTDRESSPEGEDPSSVDELRATLLASDPTATVLIAWRELEKALIAAFRRLRPGVGIQNSLSRSVADQLYQAGVVTDLLLDSIWSARKLRNEVAHGLYTVTAREAHDYQQQAARLQKLVEGRFEMMTGTPLPDITRMD